MKEETQGNPPFLMKRLNKYEWKSYVNNYNFGSIPPSRVVLHHTVIPTIEQWNGEVTMRGMQNYYRSLGWGSAPHIYVAPDGIWLATPMYNVGIHAGVGNSGIWNGKWSYSIGVEMVGNYDNEKPEGIVWDLTKIVLRSLSEVLHIPIEKLLYFHRDFSGKSCPGNAVSKKWVIDEVTKVEDIQKPSAIEIHDSFYDAWKKSGGVWKENQLTPGFATSEAYLSSDGYLEQEFERGVAVLIGDLVMWRLLREIC